MDSTNPYSHSLTYMDLLNSQQETNILEPSIELGSSEVPVFSTQCSDGPSQGEYTPEDRKARRKWSPKEDVVLISAWLNTNKDPVVGNEQKAEAFWKRIAAYLASTPSLTDLQKREPSHCKQRWGKINVQVCKFVGCYEAVTTQKSSGQNEKDVMKLANQILFNDHKVKFTLEHAWRELRHDQKWCGSSSTIDNGRSKRRKCEEGSTQSSSSYTVSHGDVGARPPGVKASKAKGKTTMSKTTTVEEEGKSLLVFLGMLEIKQKDLAMREKLSKTKLLESLLAKTDPLSEIEMVLKDKLITEILS